MKNFNWIIKILFFVTNATFSLLCSLSNAIELPDLVIESVDAPSSAIPGSTISVTVVFKNQGGDLTQGTYVRCRMIVSPDSTINLADTYYIDVDIDNNLLKSGYSYSKTFSYTLPSEIQGIYYVGAYADSATYHSESNEGNNANFDITPMVTATSTSNNYFTWPIDPTNPTEGHSNSFSRCKNKLFCYWISDLTENPQTVWYDAQGFQRYNWLKHGWHLGADYNKANDTDSSVYPTSTGVISKIIESGCGWGRVLFIRHKTSFPPYTYTSMYAHVNWTFGKPPLGGTVNPNTPIASIGNGTSDNCPNGKYPYHLHFEIRRGDNVNLGNGYWPTSKKLPCNGSDNEKNNCPQHQIDPNDFIKRHN